MMITVLPSDPNESREIKISFDDAALIERIRVSVDHIAAIRVTRWLTKATLATSKQFVDGLREKASSP